MLRVLSALAGAFVLLALLVAPASAAPRLKKVGPTPKVTAKFTGAKSATSRKAKARAAAAGTRIRVQPGSTFAGYYALETIPINPQTITDDQVLNYTVQPYRFNGATYTSIGISANGYAVVGGADTAKDAAATPSIGNAGRPNNVLAPFWTDLTPAGGGTLRVATVANTSQPPCVRSYWFVAQWDMFEFGTTTNRKAQLWIQADDPECATDPVPAQAVYFTYDFATMTAPPARPFQIGAENSTGTSFDRHTTLPIDHYVVSTEANNDAPVANDDSYTVTEGQTRVVAAPGVTGNDTDTESSPLTATRLTQPVNGTLAFNADGSFSYTPDPGFIGNDSFTYRVNDGELNSNVATVSLAVQPRPNVAPVAADDAYSTNEGVPLNVGVSGGLLGNDSDADGDPLSATRLDDVDHGTLTLNGDGSFDYVPDPGFAGADSFTYRLGDGRTTSAAATVTIDVVPRPNVAPTTAGEDYGLAAGEVLNVDAPGLLANDSDGDGDAITVAAVDAPAHGTLVMAPTGAFSYRPEPGFAGADRFGYKVTDGRVDSGWTFVTVVVAAPLTSGPGVVTGPLSTAASLTPTLGPDLTAPIISAFKLPKSARLSSLVRGISPQFRCDEACSITVRMSVRKRGAKLPTTVLQTSATSRTSGLQTIGMRLKRSRMTNLAGKEIRVSVTAVDASGNRTTLLRTLVLN